MSNYSDVREKIIKTLTQRPENTMIFPEGHEAFALALLDYCRSIELVGSSTLIGVAYPDTQPIQPELSNCAYIAGVAQGRTSVFRNFKGKEGEPISVTTQSEEAKFVILLWNREFWEAVEVSANVISQADTANYFYRLSLRKTYSSVAQMTADDMPIGSDGMPIKIGEVVSVHNPDNPEEDAIYSYEGDRGWQFQTKLSAIDGSSRAIDGGRADSVYGGALNYDCGGA